MATIKRTDAEKLLPRHHYAKTDPVRGACYLCGTKENPTREHVFSRNLFRPNDIEHPIILTACSACNARKEGIEDYVFTYMIWTTERPEADQQRKRFGEAYKARQPKILVPGKHETPKGNKLFQSIVTGMEDIPIFSQEGIYLGNGGQVKIDPKKFTEFYVTVCKGLYTSASNEIHDWSKYEVYSQYDSISYGTHWKKDLFMFAVNNAQFHEAWDSHLLFSGFIYTMNDGKRASMWSLALYDEQLAYVMLKEK
jgi:hypothetical protein